MKKAVIIFIVLFILTLAIPTVASFSNTSKSTNSELATMFEQEKADISLFPNSH